jgi:hypothetical protein
VIVQPIGATKTETGLEVRCEIDGNLYPRGVQVTELEMRAINLTRADFHGVMELHHCVQPTTAVKQLSIGGSLATSPGGGVAKGVRRQAHKHLMQNAVMI